MADKKEVMQHKEGDGLIRVFRAFAVLALVAGVAFFVYSNTFSSDAGHPFKLGLDLAGGSQLVYQADVTDVNASDVPALMNVLREVIERRINVFGVSEPNVQVERGSVVSGGEPAERLVVELPGVTDVENAISEIGRTPLLEFKLVDQEVMAAQESAAALQANASSSATATSGKAVISNVKVGGELVSDMEPYIDTGLTGRYLKSAALEFSGNQRGSLANEPIVSIVFNDEGAELFAKITRENTGENLAIFLDGELISAPRINEAITGGKAVISGGFDPEEARDLAQNLNFGALPVAIELVNTQTIGAALGGSALHAGIMAGVIGFLILSVFMVLWYRLPGVIAVVALAIYIVLMLALFQLIPVVMTAAGIAGFILSVGLAVDANVLIAERMKEELRAGKGTHEAIADGFSRAWLAIRDSNIAHIIAASVLFWFGTSLIKGFALVFGLGVVVSMLSAITISRTLLIALPINATTKVGRFLMGSGFSR